MKNQPISVKRKLTRAEKFCRWIESNLYFPDGLLRGHPFILAEFQRNIIFQIYDNPAISRRAVISMPRKNAKTALCAALTLVHLAGPEAKEGTELYSGARTKEQASMIYKDACKMILMSPALKPFIRMNNTMKTLTCTELGTVYRALSNDGSNAQGLRPQFAVIDELGQCVGPSDELLDALETGMGSQVNPLTLIISTQAAGDGDALSKIVDDMLTGADPKSVCILHTAPPDMGLTVEALKLANPAWDEFLVQQELIDQMEKAKRMPSFESEFRNKYLNQRVDLNVPFVSSAIYKEGNKTPEDYRGKEVYIGLDLSETTDLTAMVISHENEDGKSYSVHPKFWLPEDNIKERSQREKDLYREWTKKGLMIAVAGRSIDYDYVAFELMKISQECTIKKVGFDRYNIKHFRKSLLAAGFTEQWIDEHFHPFGQGYVSMSPAIRTVEDLLLKGDIWHGGSPVLGMCFANVKVISDPAGNRKFIKRASNRRIDGAISTVMAIGTAFDFADEKPKQRSYLEDDDLMVL